MNEHYGVFFQDQGVWEYLVAVEYDEESAQGGIPPGRAGLREGSRGWRGGRLGGLQRLALRRASSDRPCGVC